MSSVSAETVEQLLEEVHDLQQEVRVLRDAIDELREALEYAVQNGVPLLSPLDGHARRITSMPVDPTARDFAERVNRYTAANVTDSAENCTEAELEAERASGGQQRELF